MDMFTDANGRSPCSDMLEVITQGFFVTINTASIFVFSISLFTCDVLTGRGYTQSLRRATHDVATNMIALGTCVVIAFLSLTREAGLTVLVRYGSGPFIWWIVGAFAVCVFVEVAVVVLAVIVVLYQYVIPLLGNSIYTQYYVVI